MEYCLSFNQFFLKFDFLIHFYFSLRIFDIRFLKNLVTFYRFCNILEHFNILVQYIIVFRLSNMTLLVDCRYSGFDTHRSGSAMASFVLHFLVRGYWVLVAFCSDLLFANQTCVMCRNIRLHTDPPVSLFWRPAIRVVMCLQKVDFIDDKQDFRFRVV